MPKLGPDASKEEKRERVHEEMGKFKRGTLHSGTGRRGGKREEAVTNPKQAIAISLSEAGLSKKDKGRKAPRKTGRGGRR